MAPQPATGTYRNDAWWARVAVVLAAGIGLVSALGANSTSARLEVAGVSLAAAAGFAAKAQWPRLPTFPL